MPASWEVSLRRFVLQFASEKKKKYAVIVRSTARTTSEGETGGMPTKKVRSNMSLTTAVRRHTVTPSRRMKCRRQHCHTYQQRRFEHYRSVTRQPSSLAVSRASQSHIINLCLIESRLRHRLHHHQNQHRRHIPTQQGCKRYAVRR